MSHTTRKVNLGNTALAEVVITNYVQGGEAFTLAEFGLTGGLVRVIFLAVVGAQLTPVFVAPNLVKLFQPTGCDPSQAQELPTTNNLNFLFCAIIDGT